MLIGQDNAPFSFWNVNIPHPLDGQSSIPNEFCGLDINPHKYNFKKDENNYIYEGSIHERPRHPGTDVAVCLDVGKISITQLAVGTPNQIFPASN